MKFRKFKQDFFRFTGIYFLHSIANVLCKTLKINFINKNVIDDLENQNKNYVLAFWHGSMLLPWFINRNRNLIALTSKSKDGDLLARLLKQWNYNVLRGSSSEGGDVALEIMIDYAKNNRSIALTPDGPKGPIHKMKAGAVVTAKKSGLPLILIGIGFKRKKILNSWDKFEVPLFFTDAKIVFSNPIFIEKDLSYDETSKKINECEDILNDVHDKANTF